MGSGIISYFKMNNTKYLGLLLLACITVISANTNQPLEELAMELSSEDRNDAIQFFDECFDKVYDSNAPICTTKVTAVWNQHVSGAVIIYNGQLSDGNATKQCVIKIWESISTNIQINCDGEDPEINSTI